MAFDLSKISSNGERFFLSSSKKQIDSPDLLNVQIESFRDFLQEDNASDQRKNLGIQSVFARNFPIMDSRETAMLEFLEYYIEKPQYSIRECQEQGLTYAVSLKAKLRLSTKPNKEAKEYSNAIEQDVYMGNIPYMTHYGSFIINGAERVIVSQLHRSPGGALGCERDLRRTGCADCRPFQPGGSGEPVSISTLPDLSCDRLEERRGFCGPLRLV